MLSNLLYCVQQLNANNSSTYKIKKFKELYKLCYINEEIWNLVYKKDVLFHITSAKLEKNLALYGIDTPYGDDIVSLLKDLSTRYTGNEALAVACRFVNNNYNYKQLIYDVIDKDLHIGMTAKSINKAVPGFFPEFNVALANKYDSKKHKLDDNWVIEKKYDGIRVICIFYNKDNIKFFSRKGKEIKTLDFLKPSILKLNLPDNTVIDGEICSIRDGQESFSSIVSYIHKGIKND